MEILKIMKTKKSKKKRNSFYYRAKFLEKNGKNSEKARGSMAISSNNQAEMIIWRGKLKAG